MTGVRMMPSVYARRELRAAVAAMKLMRREVKNDVNRGTRQTMNPVWRAEVSSRASTTQQQKVLARGARIKAGNPPRAVAGTSRRPLPGGLVPAEDALVFEVGSKRRDRKVTFTRRSPKGTTHQVTRRNRQLPAYRATGRVVFPAFQNVAPRMVSLWVQTIVRKTYDALERR